MKNQPKITNILIMANNYTSEHYPNRLSILENIKLWFMGIDVRKSSIWNFAKYLSENYELVDSSHKSTKGKC